MCSSFRYGALSFRDSNFAQTHFNVETRRAERRNAAAGDLWKRIAHRDNDALQVRFQNRVGAGRRLAVMAAGFERHIQRAAAGLVARFRECVHFRMGFAETLVKAAANDLPIFRDHRADQRVRLDVAAALLRQCERFLHAVFVKRHGFYQSTRNEAANPIMPGWMARFAGG